MFLQRLEQGKLLQGPSLLGHKPLKRAVAPGSSAEVHGRKPAIELLEQRSFHLSHRLVVDGVAPAERVEFPSERRAGHETLHRRMCILGDAFEVQVEWIVKEPA
jgi:hypothetical protein